MVGFELNVICSSRSRCFCCKADFRLTCDQAFFFFFYCRISVNSPAKSSNYNITKFKTRFRARGYLHNIIEKINSEILKHSLNGRRHYNKTRKCEILSFFTPCHPVLPNLKNILKSTISSRNTCIERGSTFVMQKRKIFKRYTRESKTITRSPFSHQHSTSL